MKQCLNCQTELKGSYCHECGQKGSTHRYSFKSLVTHDLLHSIWHVDKSILRSWWRILIHPGAEGHRNIAGKRVGQFPILTLAIFATILLLLVFNFRAPDEHITVRYGTMDFSEWVRHNAKWLWLSLILLFALSAKIFFHRVRYNLAEHIVLTTYNYVALVTAGAFLIFIFRLAPANWLWLDWTTFLLFLIYLHFVSFNSFRNAYTLVGWYWRFAGAFLTFVSILLLAIFLWIMVLNQQQGRSNLKMQYGVETPADTTQPAPHK